MIQLPTRPPVARASRRRHLHPTLLAGGLALFGNAAIWTAATLLGADFEAAPTPASAMHVGIASVAIATISTLLLGGLVLRFSAPRWPNASTVLAWFGLAVAAVSIVMPLTVLAGPGTKAALVSMHLLTGTAWWFALRQSVRSEGR